MTAVRVITDHSELEGSGQLSHDQLDSYVSTTPFIIVSGSAGAIPPNARLLKVGTGISASVDGPGGNITLSIDPSYIPASTAVFNETPSGSVNGVNQIFTLAFTPFPSASLQLFYNGVLQDQGSAEDYVLSGSTVTFNFVPTFVGGHGKLRAWYQK